MSSQLGRQTIGGLIAAIAFALAAEFSAHGYSPAPLLLPERLGTLILHRQLLGGAAREMVDRMHGRGVTPSENSIGHYVGKLGMATLYLSNYGTPEEPGIVLAKMVTGIQKGQTPFVSLRRLQLSGATVWLCFGLNQIHYFFSMEHRLYWLAVDSRVAEGAITGLLQTIHPSDKRRQL